MEPKASKTCSTVDLQLRVERLAVIQEKDAEALRREINLMMDAREKLIEAKFAAKELALDLKSSEDKIHFVKLNHEAEQLKSMQATYLPREVYDAAKIEQDKQIDLLNAEKDKAIGRGTVVGVVVSFFIGLLFVLINLFFSGKL